MSKLPLAFPLKYFSYLFLKFQMPKLKNPSKKIFFPPWNLGSKQALRYKQKEKEGAGEQNDGSGNLERVDFEEPIKMGNQQDLDQNDNESFDNSNQEEHNENDDCNNDNREYHLRDSLFSDVFFEKLFAFGLLHLLSMG